MTTNTSHLSVAQNSREPDRFGSVRGLSTAGFHDIAYADWGPKDAARTVICVHGLSRQGRDFDFLAMALAERGVRVICPDLAGRGRSGRLGTALDYVFPQYCADLNALIATTANSEIHWVGSSLGGLIGLVIAAMSNSPIRRIVINDIGPSVPLDVPFLIGQRLLGIPASFKTLDEAVAYYRRAFSDYGNLDDDQWTHIARHSIEWCEQRRIYRSLFDHKITQAFHFFMYYGMTLWDYWRRIPCPVLIVRGAKSTLLPRYTAREMLNANPQARLIEFEGVGHMPMLMSSDQISPVVDFLLDQPQ